MGLENRMKKSSHIGNGPNCLAWYNFCLFWWIKNIWWQVNYIHMSRKFLLSGNLTVYWPFTPYPSLCSFLQSTYLTLFNLVQLHRFLFRKYMYIVQYHDKKYSGDHFEALNISHPTTFQCSNPVALNVYHSKSKISQLK